MSEHAPLWQVAVPAAAELGERPVWDPAANCLIWVDIERGELHQHRPPAEPATTAEREKGRQDDVFHAELSLGQEAGGGDSVLVSAGVAVGAAAPRRGGGYVLAAADGLRLVRADGSAEGAALRPDGMADDIRFNDGACDPAGRFWAGTVALDRGLGRGALYRLDPDGVVTRILDGVTESNGIGWSPDGTAMYYIDSGDPSPVVRRFGYDTFSGKITAESELAAFAPEDGIPDGLVVDATGDLWIAMWGGAAVRRYSPAGDLLAIIAVPASQPTCPGFGGPALDRLYLTSAWQDLDPARRAAEPLAGHLFVTTPGVTGLALAPYGG